MVLWDDDTAQLECTLPSQHLAEAAALLAEGIAQRRLGGNPRLRDLWAEQRRTPGSKIADDRDSSLLEAMLLENIGTPDAPATSVHLGGLVAESIWYEVITKVDEGLGLPIRVEGHDWSATDPGGDGLTVYGSDDGYRFTLWESKHHGAVAPVRDTVNGACRQMKSRSLSYLARFSLIAQQITSSDELAAFYGQLPELWVDHDPAAGVGVSVGTGAGSDIIDCFGNITSYFELDDDQLHGHLHVVSDFGALAQAVQDEIWKGCSLWTAP